MRWFFCFGLMVLQSSMGIAQETDKPNVSWDALSLDMQHFVVQRTDGFNPISWQKEFLKQEDWDPKQQAVFQYGIRPVTPYVFGISGCMTFLPWFVSSFRPEFPLLGYFLFMSAGGLFCVGGITCLSFDYYSYTSLINEKEIKQDGLRETYSFEIRPTHVVLELGKFDERLNTVIAFEDGLIGRICDDDTTLTNSVRAHQGKIVDLMCLHRKNGNGVDNEFVSTGEDGYVCRSNWKAYSRWDFKTLYGDFPQYLAQTSDHNHILITSRKGDYFYFKRKKGLCFKDHIDRDQLAWLGEKKQTLFKESPEHVKEMIRMKKGVSLKQCAVLCGITRAHKELCSFYVTQKQKEKLEADFPHMTEFFKKQFLIKYDWDSET